MRERLLNAVREYGRRCEAMGRDAGGWTEAEARAVDAAFADVVDLVDSIVTLGVQS